MALHIDPEVRAEFALFYDFALEQTPPDALGANNPTAIPDCALEHNNTLVLEHLDDAALAARIAGMERVRAEAITCVMVRNCADLLSLAPLAGLPRLACAGVWSCPKLRELWCMDTQPLWGFALTDCKSLTGLAALAACADTLRHLFLQGRAWNTPRFQTLDPLPKLHALVTCDLALRKASHSSTIYFETCFPDLKALTVTPNLAKYFRRMQEKK